MIYRITDRITEIKPEEIDANTLTTGYIKPEELADFRERFGFDPASVEASKVANPYFRTEIDVQSNYTFSELRIVNPDGHDDWISFYIMKKFVLVVDILDEDGSTRQCFLKSIQKLPSAKNNTAKIVCSFIDSLVSGGTSVIEKMRNQITGMEESVIDGTADKDFNTEILAVKKKLLHYQNYYNQILDITETLEENDNDIFEEDHLIYVTNLTNRVTRLCDEVKSLTSSMDHLQDAYSTLLDQRLNNTMKVFTIITTIFFPLTIIVGWYGMNFQSMPEFGWKYGYVYVILLAVAVVLGLVWFCKKKHWF